MELRPGDGRHLDRRRSRSAPCGRPIRDNPGCQRSGTDTGPPRSSRVPTAAWIGTRAPGPGSAGSQSGVYGIGDVVDLVGYGDLEGAGYFETAPARDVDSGLVAEGHARLQQERVRVHQVGPFVAVHSDAMTDPSTCSSASAALMAAMRAL